MGKADPDDLARRLVKAAGPTYARQAGIRLKNTPQPLFALLTLCLVMSKPISAEIAVAAARELFALGLRTPNKVLDGGWPPKAATIGRTRSNFSRNSKGLATPAPTSSCARPRTCGPGRALTSTRRRSRRRASWVCRPIRGGLASLAPRATAPPAAALIRISLNEDLRKQVTS